MKKKSPTPVKPMPLIAKPPPAAKRTILLIVGALLSTTLAANAQESTPITVSAPHADRVELLQQQFQQQELLGLRRLEGVESRINFVDRNVNRILLIFGLSATLIFALMINHQRTQNRLAGERIGHAVRDATILMDDIKRELARPEMEFLRAGYFLRRLMRQFWEHGIAITDLSHIRTFSQDPNLPVALHCMTQILLAEHDKNWEVAIAWLDQLHRLETDEPFVLLHLANTHAYMCQLPGDKKDQRRHQRLTHQYYAQFVTVARLQDESIAPTVPGYSAQPTPRIVTPQTAAPTPANISTAATATPANGNIAPKPVAADSPPAKSTTAIKKKATDSVAADSASVNTTAAAAKPEITAPAHDNIAPKPEPVVIDSAPDNSTTTADKQEITAPKPDITAADSAPANSTTTAAKQEITASVHDNIAPKPDIVAADSAPVNDNVAPKHEPVVVAPAPVNATVAAAAATTPLNGNSPLPKASRLLNSPLWKKIGDSVKKQTSGMWGDIKNSDDGETSLPFVPALIVSEIPETTKTPAETAMWRQIRQGDLYMEQTASTTNLKRRNRLIDRALTHYTQAQSHKTNETLYLNWGLTLLGKALHLPDKKRDPFFNAAIDKFLAGNVIAPHRFDFALASLYAIVGRANECKQWLEKSQESGTLDLESLRYAPDFNAVRKHAWFNEFIH